jgi:HD-GYP domain-containing protein (c-di-GMP phosphodiesterase class II)
VEGSDLRAKRFLAFSLVVGLIPFLIVLPKAQLLLSSVVEHPSALFWLGLALLVTILPVRGVAGVGALNISPLPLLTMLLLYGVSPTIIAGWLVGVIATLISRTGKTITDFERVMVNSSKHVLCLLAAGTLLWGTEFFSGGLGGALGLQVFLRLLGAHAAYFSVSTFILSIAVWLRDGRNPLDVWKANFGWGALVSWSTPLGAYLLAVFFLQGGFLLIGILVGIGLIGILTVRDHVRIKSSFIHLVEGLRMARDGNMPHLKGETKRIVELATTIGRKMHLPYRSLELLEHAAMLHNVGYIAVDRATVLKPSMLSDSEMTEIREHPESGMRILREVVGMQGVADIVRAHHESPDGTGYPRGLRGEDIPIESAIIKVAEAFVAMTSPRPHRSRILDRSEALEEIARDAGKGLDATACYFLFELMGRQDLASRVSQGFGAPTRNTVRSRLYKRQGRPISVIPRGREQRRTMALGGATVLAAVAIVLVFARLQIAASLGFSNSWITNSAAGSAFFILLLGLASLKPVRLPWGAYVSAASAVVLAVSLAGGPIYAFIFGFALIGWSMLLDPGSARASSRAQFNGLTSNGNGTKSPCEGCPRSGSNGGITSVIKSKALKSRLSTASVYGLVLMLAGAATWPMFQLGTTLSELAHLRGGAADIFPFVLSTGVFYMVETLLQSAMLAGQGLSPARIWQRNYLKIFPEPLTYAAGGYAILLGNYLLGLWATVPLFLFPTLWRHLALLRRLELLRTKDSLIRAIAGAVDEKDRYTGGHSASVVEIGVAIAREMGRSEAFVEQVEEAAIRHDLGKVSWPNQVLRKPAALSRDEEDEYKVTHPDVSANISARAGSAPTVTDMIRYHHERYDGKGYPHGLEGEEIPLGARILCVADSFDAMIHDRWYKRKRTIEGAVNEIKRCSDTQFDPIVVAAFLRVLDKIDVERLMESVEIEVGEIPVEVGAAT